MQNNNDVATEPVVSDGGIVSGLTIMLFLLLLVLSGWTGYLQSQNSSLDTEAGDLEARVERLQSAEGQDQSQVSNATKKRFLGSKRAERVLWTNVLSDFYAAIPENSSGVDLAVVRSISANEQGQLSVAVGSLGTAADPFVDAAQVFQALELHPSFAGAFIPSVSTSVTETGFEVLRYSFLVDYVGTATDLADSNVDNDTTTATRARTTTPANEAEDGEDAGQSTTDVEILTPSTDG